jgi:hypothetical protein
MIKIRDIRIVTVFMAALAVDFLQTNTLQMMVSDTVCIVLRLTHVFCVHISFDVSAQQGSGDRYSTTASICIFILFLFLHIMRSIRILYIYKW